MKHLAPALDLLRIGCALFSAVCVHQGLYAQRLQVYILAGQSNMQGHAQVETFDYIGEDAKTASLLREMRGDDGKPKVCEHVWISYRTEGRSGDGEALGRLTAGFGARNDPQKDGGKIGPEFTFGLHMEKVHAAPVLIIKTAWGGKSLHTDFRPPSAGPYVFSEREQERLRKQGKDVAQIEADKVLATGRYYRLMIDHCKHVLGDVTRVCPDYDAAKGYELAGFVWFQGWNDMVDQGVYPDREQPGGYAMYSQCLAHLIRDVRKDLGVAKLPFVIGVMGVDGPIGADAVRRKVHANFRAAMAAPAALPEFAGNVVAVQTAPFWDEKLADIAVRRGKVAHLARMLETKDKNFPNREGTMTAAQQKAYVEHYQAEVVGAEDEATFRRGASNGGYHYLGCAKTMAQIGVAFAEAVLAMQR